MKSTFFLILALTASMTARSEVQTRVVEYKLGDVVLEGWHAWDNSIPGKRPAILIVHQWKGLTDYEKKRADMLARLGYNVFALDIYGKGIRADNPKDASALAGKYKGDRALLRKRALAGLDVLKKQDLTDPRRVAVIGYCFGGTTALEVARSGAEVAGVVSFHGGLNTPTPADAKNIKSRVLVLHGADDPNVPPDEVAAFEKEMRDARADWQLVAYGGAVHSFTDWNAGNDNSKGVAYNEKADRRSWEAMKVFFAEIFKP
jgi:dienelactone hydrolase